MRILLVTASASEIEGFRFDTGFEIEHIITGVGKIAAYSAVRASLHRSYIDVIINAGTCGSTKFDKGIVLRPTLLSQADLASCPGIATEPFRLKGCTKGISCGTADVFYINRGEFDAYDCHDMEAYAVQYATLGMNIETSYIKIVSDNCNGTIHDWELELPNLRQKLADEIQNEIRRFIPKYKYEKI